MSGMLWVNEHDIEADLGLTSVSIVGMKGWSAGIGFDRNSAQLPGTFVPAVAPYAAPRATKFHVDAHGVLLIRSNPSTARVTLRDARGTPIQTRRCTITLGANAYLEIDLKWKTVTKYLSGVSSDSLSAWTSRLWDSFCLDPLNGS